VSPVIATSILDGILAWQITVAWAGEGRCEPPRLGWWQTDLIDPAGGGDLLARLLPRTHVWAGLEAVREVARRADQQAREKMAEPDRVRSLFFFGFELDELLSERLGQLKRDERPPADVLPFPLSLAVFSRDQLTEALSATGRAPAFEVVPGGRQLKAAMPDSPELAARNLAAALVPLSEQYPAPFYRAKS
jgi:hypothetical protein